MGLQSGLGSTLALDLLEGDHKGISDLDPGRMPSAGGRGRDLSLGVWLKTFANGWCRVIPMWMKLRCAAEGGVVEGDALEGEVAQEDRFFERGELVWVTSLMVAGLTRVSVRRDRYTGRVYEVRWDSLEESPGPGPCTGLVIPPKGGRRRALDRLLGDADVVDD
jgi:hypothetical protein